MSQSRHINVEFANVTARNMTIHTSGSLITDNIFLNSGSVIQGVSEIK